MKIVYNIHIKQRWRILMGKKTKNLIMLSAATVAGIYAFNKFIEATSTKKNLLKEESGTFFEWKLGDIFYKKTGSGSPVLLIHDINVSSSSEEWSKIYKLLAKSHTVYVMDLIGCGRSDKPAIQYTNYMYVQLITDFINKVIKEKTDVISTNMSCSFTIMANNMNSDLFNNIILINPVSIGKLTEVPTNMLRLKQKLYQLPLIGPFAYNIIHSQAKTDILFKTKYFKRSQLVSSKLVDTYYESAHLGSDNGRYLFSSLRANFMNINIKNAVKKLGNNVHIISSRDLKNNISTTNEYYKTNRNISITNISNGGLYPQLETPDRVLSIIKSII